MIAREVHQEKCIKRSAARGSGRQAGGGKGKGGEGGQDYGLDVWESVSLIDRTRCLLRFGVWGLG